jgi:hypothetical protein
MKRILLISLIFISNTVFSWDSTLARYLPLEIGNSWSYVLTVGTSTSIYNVRITGDTVMPNGHKYYKFTDGSYQRLDSTTMNSHKWNYGNDLLFDSLRASLGNGYPSRRFDFTWMNYIDFLNVNYFGTQRLTKRYTYQISLNFFEYNLVQNIGLCFAYRSGYPSGLIYQYEIRGCVIHGVVYGDTSNPTGLTQISNETPKSFSLSQNYPNPFNPTTKIQFSIPSHSHLERAGVRLIIYDALGHEIQTLVNELLQSGTYEVIFDASNFSSGVYYYKLETESFTQTKKMVLIK